MTESGHTHASLDPKHWTEDPLRSHLTRPRSDGGHGWFPVGIALAPFDVLFEDHASRHPEGDDRQVPEVLRSS